MTPDKATIEMLKGIQTEIGAGKSLMPSDDARIHNNACDRAIRIIENYKRGIGLFQLTPARDPNDQG